MKVVYVVFSVCDSVNHCEGGWLVHAVAVISPNGQSCKAVLEGILGIIFQEQDNPYFRREILIGPQMFLAGCDLFFV